MSSKNKEITFFLNCSSSKEDIDKLAKENKEIYSLYRVCGLEPWLIICKFESIDSAAQFAKNNQLPIKSMSIVSDLHSVDCDHIEETNNSKIVFWVFVKGKIDFHEFISFISSCNSHDCIISEIYETLGEFNFIVKIYVKNINGMDDLLKNVRQKGMSTSTKCVLITRKEENQFIETGEIIDRSETIKKDFDYILARIMLNTEGFLERDKVSQYHILKEELDSREIPYSEDTLQNRILYPDTTKSDYWPDDLVHPNVLLDRYSIKLERKGWLMVLLFFKASSKPGAKDELEEALRDNLLGVTSNHFSRKFYHITGEYDFVVPIDCKNIEVFIKLRDEFFLNNQHVISRFTNTICDLTSREKPSSLKALDIPFVESLLINATQINKFENRIQRKKREIFSFIYNQNEELSPAEEGVTPREDYVRNKINKKKSSGKAVKEYLDSFTQFNNLELKTAIEIKDGALIQILTKFIFENKRKKNKFLDKINTKKSNFELILNIYEPTRDLLSVICIITIKELDELIVLFDELNDFCEKVEFHIIFHQNFYSKVLEKEVRCKPCFYPLKPIIPNCQKSCDECLQTSDCTEQNCGTCIRYILPRQKNRNLNVNLKGKHKRNLMLSVVGIDIKLSDFFLLEPLMDQGNIQNKTFNNYKIIYESLPSKAKQIYQNYYSILKEFTLKNKIDFRNEYETAILDLLKNNLISSPTNIIVFPEYSIPLYVYNKIKGLPVKKECMIVAGSHIENRFNVAPIILCEESGKKQIYHYFKNHFNPLEKQLGLLENSGTAFIKFFGKWGNIYIQLCHDVFTARKTGFKETDVLIIPSYNPSTRLIRTIESKVSDYKFIAAYANTINTENLQTRFFLPPHKGTEATLEGIKPFHEKDGLQNNIANEEPIFELLHDQKTEINGFNFLIKQMKVNISELDRLRGVPSRRVYPEETSD